MITRLRHLSPRLREIFVAPIPEPERKDMMLAYHAQLNAVDEEVRIKAAKAWSTWECVFNGILAPPLADNREECGPRSCILIRTILLEQRKMTGQSTMSVLLDLFFVPAHPTQ